MSLLLSRIVNNSQLSSFYGVSAGALTVRSRVAREPTLCNRAAVFSFCVSEAAAWLVSPSLGSTDQARE